MIELVATFFSVAFVAQFARIAVPYALAATGGALSERSGVVNVALEGKMLAGAFCAALVAIETQSVALGFVGGVVGGVGVAACYGLAVLVFRADQIVVGVAINMFVVGLTRVLLKLCYGSASNSPDAPGLAVGVFSRPSLYLAGLAVVGCAWLVTRTRFGLRLRAVGEHPDAAASVGISIRAVRWRAVWLGGALAGAGGAWLALDNRQFVAEMTNGRGYIALAAVIMGNWRPGAAALACLFFAFAEAAQFNLQAFDWSVPRELVQVLPHVLTVIVLAGVVGKNRAPKALGQPY